MAYKSRQRAHGGGKFKSEDQRRFMWATRPKAARAWAHNENTRPSQWQYMTKAQANAYKRRLKAQRKAKGRRR